MKTFTQEVNFTSPSDSDFQYVVGGYYYHNYKYYPSFQYNGIEFLDQDQWATSLAGYADGTYKLGDFSIIAGIRYSTEKRRMNNSLLPHPLTPVAAQGSRSIKRRESAWTPRFGLRYALDSRSNIYATYSKGFKSGAFNGTSLTSPGVTPETIDSFELGYKTSGPGYTLSAATYYSEYKDIQANTLIIVNGVALNNTVNAAKARINGFEFDGTYQFSDALNVRAAFAYTEASYTSFPNAPGYAALGGGAYTTVPRNATGNAMVRQPKYQASAQVNYTVPVGDNSLTFTLSPSYNSRIYFDFTNSLSQKPVLLLDGAVEMDFHNGLKASIFGRNITDRIYSRSQGYSTFMISNSYGEPATYGVKLSYAFE